MSKNLFGNILPEYILKYINWFLGEEGILVGLPASPDRRNCDFLTLVL